LPVRSYGFFFVLGFGFFFGGIVDLKLPSLTAIRPWLGGRSRSDEPPGGGEPGERSKVSASSLVSALVFSWAA
jgi:hypothetical protein